MATIHRLKFLSELLQNTLSLPRFEKELLRTVDESGAYIIELSDGAVDQALVLTGTGGIDTWQTLIVIVDRVTSIRPGGAGATSFPLQGSPLDPAMMAFFRTSVTATPVMSNSSGALALVTVIVGGT